MKLPLTSRVGTRFENVSLLLRTAKAQHTCCWCVLCNAAQRNNNFLNLSKCTFQYLLKYRNQTSASALQSLSEKFSQIQ